MVSRSNVQTSRPHAKHQIEARVEATELGGERLHRVRRLREARHVELPDDRPPAEPFDLAGGALGAIPIAVPGDTDVEPLAREPNGGRLADARVGAGDDRG